MLKSRRKRLVRQRSYLVKFRLACLQGGGGVGRKDVEGDSAAADICGIGATLIPQVRKTGMQSPKSLSCLGDALGLSCLRPQPFAAQLRAVPAQENK